LTLEQVASSAFIALGLENDAYKPIFYQWAFDATRSIGLSSTQLKTAELNISNGAAAIPSDMIMPYNFALRSSASNEVAYPFFDSTFWKATNVPSNDQVHSYSLVINIQGTDFVFSSGVTDGGFDRLIVEYYTLPVDNNNVPLIPEFYQEAITAYIEFMYLKRKRNQDRTLIPYGEVQGFENRWNRLKYQAISKKNMPSKPELDGAISRWLTMLPNYNQLQRYPNIKTSSN
jgi:hypothetical protein